MTLLDKLKQPSYLKYLHTLENQAVIPYLAQDNQLDEQETCDIICELLQYQTLEGIDLTTATPDLKVISAQDASQHAILYLTTPTQHYLLVCNPFDTPTIRYYQHKYGDNGLLVVVAVPYQFDPILANYVSNYSTLEVTTREDELSEGLTALETISLDSIHHEKNEIIRIVNSVIYESLKRKASDIHIEVRGDNLLVFYRIDGSLINMLTLKGKTYTEQVISRIKILANLDIAENRIPQDGRIKLNIDNHAIDFRVSIMPSIYGEDAVLRILDGQRLGKDNQSVTLADLNFPTEITALLKKMLLKQNGMVLITGPTGSGKTTTLYAMLDEVNTGLDKIITIEDPIEYALNGVLQIPVNEKKGLTFAKGLRSILRHDPDIIMVGEIRDSETATIAVQAALTGHLVFTTVHANNVFNVINRFRYMDVESFSLVSALNCVVSQRLVKLLCQHCATTDNEQQDLPLLKEILSDNTSQIHPAAIKKAVGCEHCYHTGYRNRQPINELLVIDDGLRTQLMSHDSLEAVKQYAQQQGNWIQNTQQLITLLNQGRIDLKQFLKYAE